MRILVIVVHPTMEESAINKRLKKAIVGKSNILVHDLYDTYPDENIDIKREQQLLEGHDRVVFQFPNYWYSYPPLLKKWFDLVLERGWAFRGKHALQGKEFGIAVSSGFTREDYRFDGLHRHTIEQVMASFFATCNFIRVKSIPMFTTFEDELETEEDLERMSQQYLAYLRKRYSFHRNTYK
ncbi:NAD(P)H-dependent oxidoreductase [Aquibacillus albus]|uniref:NADPH-quinone reductase n=1 Tax=Aquibacillus albus TaxID=1168171 RepID=A0ABS2N5H6_9BACI|nr:NAD(P)H-dependent oxidoreductase [Aquibacillus albus]MBM7573385.1 putative NADPH-quinone reductase [Aquibacillus albus]